MSVPVTTFPGVVRDGVVVLDGGVKLAEGMPVAVQVPAIDCTAEERAEADDWERLSDEAWSQIDWGEGEIARDSG